MRSRLLQKYPWVMLASVAAVSHRAETFAAGLRGPRTGGCGTSRMDQRPDADSFVGVERRSRRTSSRARRLWRDARGDRSPCRDGAAAGRRLARQLRHDRSQPAQAVRRVADLGSGHGSVPGEPGRGGADRSSTRRRARRAGPAERLATPAAARHRQILLRPAGQQPRNAAARPVVGQPDAHHATAARGKADAVLARPLRDRSEQGARLPDDAAAERDVPRGGRRGASAIC